jgi:hypothetical protein
MDGWLAKEGRMHADEEQIGERKKIHGIRRLLGVCKFGGE